MGVCVSRGEWRGEFGGQSFGRFGYCDGDGSVMIPGRK